MHPRLSALAALATLAGLTLVSAVSGAEARDQIRIVGSSTVFPFSTAVAEEFGLMGEIGGWVFEQAVAVAGRWHERFGRVIQIGVNKSPLQFAEIAGTARWRELLKSLNLPENSLVVEVAECILAAGSPRMSRRLLDVRENGVAIAVSLRSWLVMPTWT